ncbi:hypothetical protein [Kutzneria sp. 744]|uniref:hypothetical protein n=1 Tax=Kutzneria sp. (strain 744) TaxID=345341 RepID=UPI0012FBC5C5|nr:hypothetical protein [Kutzneria sp. 744]
MVDDTISHRHMRVPVSRDRYRRRIASVSDKLVSVVFSTPTLAIRQRREKRSEREFVDNAISGRYEG